MDPFDKENEEFAEYDYDNESLDYADELDELDAEWADQDYDDFGPYADETLDE